MKKINKYANIWIALVNLKAREGFNMVDLIDNEGKETNHNFIGAWANILVKANTIKEAVEIIPLGLEELNFEVIFINKIENVETLIEYDELKKSVKKEIKWLIKSDFVFKISDKLFTY